MTSDEIGVSSDGTERLLPSDVVQNKKADVSKRIPQLESLRRGSNVPNGMDMYLAGYIDAHYELEGDLESLLTYIDQFDQELRDLRFPTCHQCGQELGEDWRHRDKHTKEEDEHPADCPNCGENPLPPVGGRQNV